jgi:hypothetical protein
MRLLGGAVVVIACVGLCRAQQPLPDPATYQPTSQAEAARLQKGWLHSGDPRLIAWAAELIAGDARRALIPDLIARLDVPGDVSVDMKTALRAVADALIQLQAQVPANLVMKLPSWYATQQIILLAKSPDRYELLMRFFGTSNGFQWLAAANLLAAKPGPDFAMALLRDFHIEASFLVISPGMGYGGGGAGCGGDWAMGLPNPGWPPINYYELSLKKGALFTPGVHPVRYYPYQSGGERELECSSTEKDQFIPGLLAQVCQIPIHELRLAARINETIVYRGAESYLANLRAILAPLDMDFQRVLNSYGRLSFLTPSEASALRLPVDIAITDRRDPSNQELPPPPEEFAFLALKVHLVPDRCN